MRTIQKGNPCSDERTRGYGYDDAERPTRDVLMDAAEVIYLTFDS